MRTGMGRIAPCDGCLMVAICRTKLYKKLLKDCSLMRRLVSFTSQIRTDLLDVEEILAPTGWEIKVGRENTGRVMVTVLEKSNDRYVRIEAEYDLCEYISYPEREKSEK